MKILFLTLELTYPPTNGLSLRSCAVAAGLVECGHEVSVLGFGDTALTGPVACERLAPVQFHPASLSGAWAPRARLRALALAQPYSTARFASAEMRRRIAAALATGRFDAVMTDTVFGAVNLPTPVPVPLLVNTHNLEHLLLRRYAARERRPAHRLYGAIEWRLLRGFEARLWKRARLVMTCSEFDAAAVARLAPGTPCAVVPNVVDVDAYVPAPAVDEPIVLHSGGLDWFPNRDAIDFFTDRVWPELRRRNPQARLILAGRNGPREWQARVARLPGVTCLGPVPDMRATIAAAAVCIVPLRIGSGTRLKILEAAAMAKPIVSTALGAEGLAFQSGHDILLADRPAEFAAHLEQLLGDAAHRRQLGAAARRTVTEKYGHANLRHSLRQALAQATLPAPSPWPVAAASGEGVPS